VTDHPLIELGKVRSLFAGPRGCTNSGQPGSC